MATALDRSAPVTREVPRDVDGSASLVLAMDNAFQGRGLKDELNERQLETERYVQAGILARGSASKDGSLEFGATARKAADQKIDI